MTNYRRSSTFVGSVEFGIYTLVFEPPRNSRLCWPFYLNAIAAITGLLVLLVCYMCCVWVKPQSEGSNRIVGRVGLVPRAGWLPLYGKEKVFRNTVVGLVSDSSGSQIRHFPFEASARPNSAGSCSHRASGTLKDSVRPGQFRGCGAPYVSRL
jgi:hypothetical protein